jgi:iron complex outermembrane receptor protein
MKNSGPLYVTRAIGGTINLTPTKPGFDNDGETTLEVGNYSYVHVMSTQDVKASDSVALRAAVDYAYDDGYEVTGADSKNDISVRLSTNINPTDRTGAYAGPFGTTDAQRNHYKTDMLGGQIDYQLDGAALSYIPSYLYLDARPLYWLSAIQSTNTAHYNQLTQELRISSTGDGPFKWLGGLYYYNSRNSGSEYLFTNLPFSFYQTNVDADRLQGYSAFGQLTYSITDTFRITGGGRGSSTDRTARGFEVVALGGLPYEFDKTYNHFDASIISSFSPTTFRRRII